MASADKLADAFARREERGQAPRRSAAEITREWRKNNPDKVKAKKKRERLKLYGLTEEEHAEILKEQNFSCAICGNLFEPGRSKRRECVDHDHKTGRVRGLLCAACNRGIGLLEDSAEIVGRAVDYLKKHG